MSKEVEMLNNDIKLAKGITGLSTVVDNAITILAAAILELEDPANSRLSFDTREALLRLAEPLKGKEE